MDPLDEVCEIYAGPFERKGIFEMVKNPEYAEAWNKWYALKVDMKKSQEKERDNIEKRVYNKHFNKYGLRWQKPKN